MSTSFLRVGDEISLHVDERFEKKQKHLPSICIQDVLLKDGCKQYFSLCLSHRLPCLSIILDIVTCLLLWDLTSVYSLCYKKVRNGDAWSQLPRIASPQLTHLTQLILPLHPHLLHHNRLVLAGRMAWINDNGDRRKTWEHRSRITVFLGCLKSDRLIRNLERSNNPNTANNPIMIPYNLIIHRT